MIGRMRRSLSALPLLLATLPAPPPQPPNVLTLAAIREAVEKMNDGLVPRTLCPRCGKPTYVRFTIGESARYLCCENLGV